MKKLYIALIFMGLLFGGLVIGATVEPIQEVTSKVVDVINPKTPIHTPENNEKIDLTNGYRVATYITLEDTKILSDGNGGFYIPKNTPIALAWIDEG